MGNLLHCRSHDEKTSICQLKQWQNARQTRQLCEPAPPGQAPPHSDKGRGTIEPRTIGTLHMKACKQCNALCIRERIAFCIATDIHKAQAAVALALCEAFYMCNFSAA
jgi:hypothetical protein